jgi:hypothetical protein
MQFSSAAVQASSFTTTGGCATFAADPQHGSVHG